jgi:hypothetical protein
MTFLAPVVLKSLACLPGFDFGSMSMKKDARKKGQGRASSGRKQSS